MPVMRAVALLLGLALLVGGCSSQAAQRGAPADGVTLFEGAWLFSADGSTPIEQAAVLVDGDRIVAVGPKGAVAVDALAEARTE